MICFVCQACFTTMITARCLEQITRNQGVKDVLFVYAAASPILVFCAASSPGVAANKDIQEDVHKSKSRQ